MYHVGQTKKKKTVSEQLNLASLKKYFVQIEKKLNGGNNIADSRYHYEHLFQSKRAF